MRRLFTIFSLLAACTSDPSAAMPADPSEDGGQEDASVDEDGGGKGGSVFVSDGREGRPRDTNDRPIGAADPDSGVSDDDSGAQDADAGAPDADSGAEPWGGWAEPTPTPGAATHCYLFQTAIAAAEDGDTVGGNVRGIGSVYCAPQGLADYTDDNVRDWLCQQADGSFEAEDFLQGSFSLLDVPQGAKTMTLRHIEVGGSLDNGYVLLYRQDEFEAWASAITDASAPTPTPIYSTNNRGTCFSEGDGEFVVDLQDFEGSAPVVATVSEGAGFILSSAEVSADYTFSF